MLVTKHELGLTPAEVDLQVTQARVVGEGLDQDPFGVASKGVALRDRGVHHLGIGEVLGGRAPGDLGPAPHLEGLDARGKALRNDLLFVGSLRLGDEEIGQRVVDGDPR